MTERACSLRAVKGEKIGKGLIIKNITSLALEPV
jgi:hypothetical protein